MGGNANAKRGRIYHDLTESVRLVPWWPDGHFNCAVVLSETHDDDLAVREMKRYLLLVPNAPDAEAAQNNIYKMGT